MQTSVARLLAAGDVDALIDFHRAHFGDARMDGEGAAGEGGQGGGAGAGGAGGSAGGGQGGDQPRFTQADMNATVARETEAAKRKAEQDIATALGVTLDEAKQIIADRRAADDAKRTEAERAAEAWKTAQTGAEAIKTEAERERHEAKVERALARAGLDVDNQTILTAAMAAVGTQVQVGADADAIKAAVDKAKTDAPALFTGTTTTTTTTTTDPGGQRRTTEAPGGEFGGRGAAEAARRWGGTEQKTA